MANKSTVMKLANGLHFRKSDSHSNVFTMVKKVKFLNKFVGATFQLLQSALFWLRKYASSKNNRTGRSSVKKIKNFVLWMNKRTSAKQKKQNWSSYFNDRIEI